VIKMNNKKIEKIAIFGILLVINLSLLILLTSAQSIPFESSVSAPESASFGDLMSKGQPTASPFNSLTLQPSQQTTAFDSLVYKAPPPTATAFENFVGGKVSRASPFESLIGGEKPAKKIVNLNWIYIASPLFLVIIFLAYYEVSRKKGYRDITNLRKQHTTNSIRDYAITNLRKGFSKEQIKDTLIKNNYTHQEIEEAFKGIR